MPSPRGGELARPAPAPGDLPAAGLTHRAPEARRSPCRERGAARARPTSAAGGRGRGPGGRGKTRAGRRCCFREPNSGAGSAPRRPSPGRSPGGGWAEGAVAGALLGSSLWTRPPRAEAEDGKKITGVGARGGLSCARGGSDARVRSWVARVTWRRNASEAAAVAQREGEGEGEGAGAGPTTPTLIPWPPLRNEGST